MTGFKKTAAVLSWVIILVLRQIDKYEICPAGCYKVALVFDASYHWYRQNDDGFWSQKNGSDSPLKVDDMSCTIVDPLYSYSRSYSPNYIAYFAVQPWFND